VLLHPRFTGRAVHGAAISPSRAKPQVRVVKPAALGIDALNPVSRRREVSFADRDLFPQAATSGDSDHQAG